MITATSGMSTSITNFMTPAKKKKKKNKESVEVELSEVSQSSKPKEHERFKPWTAFGESSQHLQQFVFSRKSFYFIQQWFFSLYYMLVNPELKCNSYSFVFLHFLKLFIHLVKQGITFAFLFQIK